MEATILFGTYNVPPINESLSASFTAPGLLPKEEMAKIMFVEEENQEYLFSFNKNLKKALEYNPKKEKD